MSIFFARFLINVVNHPPSLAQKETCSQIVELSKTSTHTPFPKCLLIDIYTNVHKQKEKKMKNSTVSAHKNIFYNIPTHYAVFKYYLAKQNTVIDPQVKEASNTFYSLLSWQNFNDRSKL